MPRPPPPLAPALPPFRPISWPARAREAARALPSLSLADEPAPPASPPLARSLHWQTGPTGQPRRLPCVRCPVVPSIIVPSPSLRRPLAAQGEFGTAPSSPLDQRPCPVPPRRGVSSAPLCGINVGVVRLIGAAKLCRSPPLGRL
jgi:hypothetical protein